jgi:parallel beta-helix repeat protein
MHLDHNSVFGVALSETHGGEITSNRVSGGVGGLLVDAGADNRIADNTVGGSSSYGIQVTGSDSNDVVGNALTEDGVGVRLNNGADGNVVTGNSFALNGQFAGIDGSIVVLDSGRNTIARNVIDQTTGFIAIGLIRAPESRVLTNQLTTGENGIILIESEHVLVSDNAVSDHETGINVGRDSRLNLVRGNEVSGSSFAGFFLQRSSENSFTDNRVSDSGTGILLTIEVSDNVFRRNLVTGSRGAGIMLDGGWNFGVAEGNRFVGNHVISNAGDGLWSSVDSYFPEFTGTIVRHNVFERNGDDGLDLDGPSNIVAHNRADRNGDLGIEAHPGVVDGGGNRAKHNGNPAQCIGVRCR